MLELTENKNLHAYIRTNIGILEDLLDQRTQRFIEVQAEKEKYDLGPRLTPSRLVEIAGEVMPITNNLLEVEGVAEPRISMFRPQRELAMAGIIGMGTFSIGFLTELLDGFDVGDLGLATAAGLIFGAGSFLTGIRDYLGSAFRYDENHMLIGERTEVPVPSVVAHEYAHQLQAAYTILPTKKRNPIVEGHARGVEGVIGRLFADTSGNPGYEMAHVRTTAEELKHAYLHACRWGEVTARTTLVDTPVKTMPLLYRLKAEHYAIGVAAMEIAQAKNGEEVLRRVMKNDFTFLAA